MVQNRPNAAFGRLHVTVLSGQRCKSKPRRHHPLSIKGGEGDRQNDRHSGDRVDGEAGVRPIA